MNPEMRYRVISVKDEADRESVLVYAVDRDEALQQVPGLLASPPIVLGEIEGLPAFLTCSVIVDVHLSQVPT